MKHVSLDAFQGYRSRLDEVRLIYELLEELPSRLGLMAAMPPFILPYYHGVKPDDCGISAFVILPGGHFTIHTFSYREAYFVDLLGGVDFDHELLLSEMQRVLPANKIDTQILRRAPFSDPREVNPAQDFGPHLFLDIEEYHGPGTLHELFDLFDALPEKIGMTPIMRPLCLKSVTAAGEQVVSAVTMIAESHIALHVYLNARRAFFDIFSCRFFDVDFVLPVLLRALPGGQTRSTFIARGKDYNMWRTDRERRGQIVRHWLSARPMVKP